MNISRFLFFLLLSASFTGFSQTYKFRTFTHKDGLPQDYIYTLIQSKQGELWAGTGEGLTKFDGKEFRKFASAEGISNNFVTASLKDQHQQIWIGHFNGDISFYNNNSFDTVRFRKILSSPVTTFFEDKAGNIWIGSKSSGLAKIDRSLSIRKYNDFKDQDKKCIYGGINSITQDKAGYLWLGTDKGLIKCSYANERLSRVKEFFPDTSINAVYAEPSSSLILAGSSESGLLAVNSVSSKLATFRNSFADENINLITADKEGSLWISSYGAGIFKCRLTNFEIEISEHFNEGCGLVSNYVKSLLIDRENNIWFGTYGSGLAQLIDHTFTIFTRSDGLAGNNIKAIDQDKVGNLYVATDYNISLLARGTPSFLPLNEIRTSSPITSIKTLDSVLLIGTESDGLYSYNLANKKFSLFYRNDKIQLLNKINHVVTDKWKNIWIATEGGLISYRRNCTCFSVFTMNEGLPHNKIYSLHADSRNRIWLATHGSGISYIKNDQITVYPSNQKMRGLDINCFAEDKLGGLWFGTNGQGFSLFQNGKVQRGRDTIMPGSPYCYFLIFDNSNKLWIGHRTGLSKYNTQLSEFVFFETDDENILSEVNHNAALKDGFGNLWFGTINGLVKYNPRADIPKRNGPIVNLNSILLNYETVNWKDYTDSTYYFGRIPFKLKLPYDKNHLTFRVSGVTLKAATTKVRFRYILEGKTIDTLETNEPFVTYTHLPPGTYTLRIKAGTQPGIWGEMEKPFIFTIRSPFWETWWFISCTLVSCFFMVSGYVKIRTDRLRAQREKLRKDKQILEAEIRERIKAQQQQKLVEEKLKETNQELNNFIYRSSHDLRGPISTVKGLTQLGAIEVKDKEAQKFFSLILDRTHVLDSVLKNLINIVEVIEGQIVISEINFSDVYNKNKEELLKINKDTAIEMHFRCNLPNHFYNDYNLVETVFKNIMDNSIKYRRNGIQSFLSVEIKESKDGISLKFEDNGIGISDEIRPRIFDMFYRGTDESKGSGLGLYTVKKIVDKLNGSLEVISSVNKGTSVLIYLPCLKT